MGFLFFFGPYFSSAQLLAEALDKESSDAGYLALCILERQFQVLDRMALTLPHAK